VKKFSIIMMLMLVACSSKNVSRVDTVDAGGQAGTAGEAGAAGGSAGSAGAGGAGAGGAGVGGAAGVGGIAGFGGYAGTAGTSGSGGAAGAAGMAGAAGGACVPTTCDEFAADNGGEYACDVIEDGCGGFLDCGTCHAQSGNAYMTCGKKNVCGGGCSDAGLLPSCPDGQKYAWTCARPKGNYLPHPSCTWDNVNLTWCCGVPHGP